MNQNTLSPDDPRLTAYALGEMSAAERAEFDALLQADPAAQRTVDEIRAAGAMLASALEAEPASNVGAIQLGDDPAREAAASKQAHRKLIRFPQFYYLTSGLAAACFAVFFVYWQNQQPAVPQKTYSEVDLQNFARQKKVEAAEEPGDPGLAAAPAPAAAPPSADAAPMSAQAAVAQSRARVELRDMNAVEAEGLKSAYHAARESEAKQKVDFAVTGSGLALAAPRAEPARQQDGNDEFNTEAYGFRKDNDFQRVADHPLSTFSIDVDTASYANVRRFLLGGRRPPIDAVRIEELLNYFPYQYRGPEGEVPFAANIEVAAAPWAPEHRLVRIGLKGREVSDAARPAANLVFLVDVSGSMQAANKLPLVKQSLRLLAERLRDDDRVAIAVYAGTSGLALPSTPAARRAEILAAIDRLEAGGSTNGGMGIQLAYDIAKANFVTGGVNRVILATDGDFNVGVTNDGALTRLIEEKAKSGVFLSVLGFGMGNYKDSTLEALADKGNGNYAYIDTLNEAKKALVEQAGGTLMTIARDVKIQVEFNPAQVQAYRLIGYENRLLAKEDFANDQIDAGEIGAGHTVTALYEIVPAGARGPAPATADEPLRYQPVAGARSAENRKGKPENSISDELMAVAIRYKDPTSETSRRLLFPMRDDGRSFEQASPDFKFAAAVAGFGMVLRDSPHKAGLTLADVSAWGRAGLGSDPGSYRQEFLTLVQKAKPLL